MIYVAEDGPHYRLRPDGSLRDISPTLLALLKIEEPKQMTGGDLRVPLAK
jgi:2,3-bisphosphoglycerate-independent phosphoglycerate mutase